MIVELIWVIVREEDASEADFLASQTTLDTENAVKGLTQTATVISVVMLNPENTA
jgi:hypothetical protein